jgi:hypothetical protein
MARHERNLYFKRLCELRDQYRTRGAADRRGTTTLAEAIAAAELAMLASSAKPEQPPAA